MNSPRSAEPLSFRVRTAVARFAMRQAAGFVALVAPWLAVPSDRRMSRVTLATIAAVLTLGLGTTAWLGIEAVRVVIHRVERQEVVQ